MRQLIVVVFVITVAAALPQAGRPAVVNPPGGRTWVCFQAPSGRVLKCLWLPTWLANRLPCSNCGTQSAR